MTSQQRKANAPTALEENKRVGQSLQHGNMWALGPNKTARMASGWSSLPSDPAGRKQNHFKVPINCFCFLHWSKWDSGERVKWQTFKYNLICLCLPAALRTMPSHSTILRIFTDRTSVRKFNLKGLWWMDTLLTFRKPCLLPREPVCRGQTRIETKPFQTEKQTGHP